MPGTGQIKISQRGQLSLPADVRRRWELHHGGSVSYLDLGEAVVLVPVADLQRELMEIVTEQDWQAARSGFGDPELANE